MKNVQPHWKRLDPTERTCALCHLPAQWNDPLDEHHVFGGPYRKASDEDGMVVLLHHIRCHEGGKESVHRCRETDLKLKRAAQKAWLAYDKSRTTEDFIRRYGKNYL